MIGSVIGNYQITGELAQGNMGLVFRGHHVSLSREVVIKEVALAHLPISTRIQLKARFRREIFVHAQLDHPGIARMYECFAKGDSYYLVREYVQGLSLCDLLKRQGVPTSSQAIYLCKQALAALDYAHNFVHLSESDVHKTGVVHGDLQPGNMIVDARGRLKIKDFGIVKMPERDSLALPSYRPGTAEYIPPEQLRGLQLDMRSDIYSLGMTFYETLTGDLPSVQTAIVSENLKDHEDGRWGASDYAPVSVADVRSDVDAPLSSIFMRAINRNPSERFQTAAEFLDAIKEYEIKSGVVGAPTGTPIPLTTRDQPHDVAIIEITPSLEKPNAEAGLGGGEPKQC